MEVPRDGVGVGDGVGGAGVAAVGAGVGAVSAAVEARAAARVAQYHRRGLRSRLDACAQARSHLQDHPS